MRTLNSPAQFGALVILALLAACGGDEPSRPDFNAHPVTVTPTEQWAGGPVTLHSAAFADLDGDTVDVAIDTFTVVATRAGAQAFEFTLPTRAPGGATPVTVDADGEIGSTTISIGGLTSEALVPVMLGEVNPQPWPWDHPAGLLGTDPVTTHPTYVDPRDGTVRVFTTIQNTSPYSPGTSYRPDVATVRDSAGLSSWVLDLLSGGATLDTAPGAAYDLQRQAFEIAPHQWLITGPHWTPLILADSVRLFPMESPWYFVRSPDGATATFIVNWARWDNLPALPIVEIPTRKVLRTIPDVAVTDAAAWSLGGDALFLASHPWTHTPQSLVKVDPGTGMTVDSVPAGSKRWTWWLAVDQTDGTLYDLEGEGDWWTLVIRDPSTLDVRGRVEFPVRDNFTGATFPLVIPDRTTRQIHVMYAHNDGVRIQRIAMP